MSEIERPTDEELIQRLEELSQAVTKGLSGQSEFTMRVPAEPKRDADLVLSYAAIRIKQLSEALSIYADKKNWWSKLGIDGTLLTKLVIFSVEGEEHQDGYLKAKEALEHK